MLESVVNIKIKMPCLGHQENCNLEEVQLVNLKKKWFLIKQPMMNSALCQATGSPQEVQWIDLLELTYSSLITFDSALYGQWCSSCVSEIIITDLLKIG